MVINFKTRTIMVFAYSKTAARDYKMDGYAWVSSMDNIVFTKERVFNGRNWGWYPYFDVLDGGNIILNYFSYENYYSIQAARNDDGTWTNKNVGDISPSYAEQLWKEHERILLIDAEGNTSVDLIEQDKAYDVYDLQGHKVRSDATDLKGLSKGIYIINGRKVLIK